MLLALLNNDLTIAQQNVVVLEQDNLNLKLRLKGSKRDPYNILNILGKTTVLMSFKK